MCDQMSSSKTSFLFQEKYIFLDVEAENQQQVFQFISERMKELDLVNEGFYEALSKREKDFPTALSAKDYAIALPHTYPQFIKKPFIAVVKPIHPIPFIEMATKDKKANVHLIFVLGYCNGKNQVNVLQSIVEEFVQGEGIDKFLQLKEKKEKLYFLRKLENKINFTD